ASLSRQPTSRPSLPEASVSLQGDTGRERTNVYTLMAVQFEWDPQKEKTNLREHGISFSEAASVLEDDFGITREDPAVVEEQRFVTLGVSDKGNLLVVVHAFREPDTILLISAWKANRRQKGTYEENRS